MLENMQEDSSTLGDGLPPLGLFTVVDVSSVVQSLVMDIKKAWKPLLPVPHSEALDCPLSSERATQKPTPICISHSWYTYANSLVITHPWTSTVAKFLDDNRNFPDFRVSRTKRQVNAFIILSFPLPRRSS